MRKLFMVIELSNLAVHKYDLVNILIRDESEDLFKADKAILEIYITDDFESNHSKNKLEFLFGSPLNVGNNIVKTSFIIRSKSFTLMYRAITDIGNTSKSDITKTYTENLKDAKLLYFNSLLDNRTEEYNIDKPLINLLDLIDNMCNYDLNIENSKDSLKLARNDFYFILNIAGEKKEDTPIYGFEFVVKDKDGKELYHS